MEKESAQYEVDEALKIDRENAQHVKTMVGLDAEVLALKVRTYAQHMNICDHEDLNDLNEMSNLLTLASHVADRISKRKISDHPRGA